MINRALLSSLLASVGDSVIRCLEAFGQNPSPARDPGFCVWPYLRARGESRPLLPARALLADDPHLSIGTSW